MLKDFRNDSDVDNPNKMSLFSVFFHSVLCCVGVLGHLLFKRMFSWAFCRQAQTIYRGCRVIIGKDDVLRCAQMFSDVL